MYQKTTSLSMKRVASNHILDNAVICFSLNHEAMCPQINFPLGKIACSAEALNPLIANNLDVVDLMMRILESLEYEVILLISIETPLSKMWKLTYHILQGCD